MLLGFQPATNPYFFLEPSFPFFRSGDKLLMFLAIGVEGLVSEGFPDGTPVFQEQLGSLAEIGFPEFLPDIFYCLIARVQHIFLVESVITKFIVHDFVSWKTSSTHQDSPSPSGLQPTEA